MIAVTGTTGFVGFYLAKALKARGEDFVCLIRASSRNKERLNSISCTTKQVDFQTVGSIADAIKGCDSIIHVLGVTNGKEENLQNTNVEITRNVVAAAKSQGIKKIVYVSSVAAILRHGRYGETKFEAEEIIRKSGIPYLIFRPAFIFGLGDENNTGLMMKTLKGSPLVPLLGGGDFKLQPVYVEDVISLLTQSISTSNINKEYTVAGAKQIALKEILILLSKNMNVKPIFIPIPLKPIQALLRIYIQIFKNTKLPVKQILELDKHEAFDISQTQKDFNFNPIEFHEGVERMFNKNLCAV